MPMFDIKNSENIELNENKTDQSTLAKLDNVKNFKATKNVVNATPSNATKEEIFELKPNFYGIGVNLKALFKHLMRFNKK